MDDEDGYFGKRIAATYDQSYSGMFEPSVATLTISSNYVQVIDGRGEYTSTPFRYVWPAELDLMAQLAGLQLRERWHGWTREPFTRESWQHVSIWRKPTS